MKKIAPKIFVFTSLFLLTSNLLFAQAPANDNCANAVIITPGAVSCTSGNNTNATADGTAPTGCAGVNALTSPLANKSVWYKVTTTYAQTVIDVTNGGSTLANFNLVVSAYASCGGSSISCANSGGNNAAESLVLTAPGTYWIRIDGIATPVVGGATGPFCISANEFNPPQNDNCANAIPLTLGDPCKNGTNVNASAGTPTPSGCAGIGGLGGGSLANRSVWYSFEASGPWSSVEVTGSPNLDIVLSVFANSCSGSSIKCLNANGVGGDEAALVSTVAGTTYYVMVDGTGSGGLFGGSGGPQGPFCISVKNEDLPPAPDGHCANAMPFCTGQTFFYPAAVNSGNASDVDPGLEYACLNTSPNPAWYYLKILDPGDLTIYMSSDAGADIDFVAWGPFSSLDNICSQIPLNNTSATFVNNTINNTANPQPPHPSYPSTTVPLVVDCSYDTRSYEYVHFLNTQQGEYYMLCILNFANAVHNITFSQQFDPNGTPGVDFGTTDCAIMNPTECSISSLTAVPSACDPATNQYTITGEITFDSPPSTGTLIVSNGATQQSFSAPFTSPQSYTLTGFTSDGALHSINATFSDTICDKNKDYTAPASCTGCSVTATANPTQICLGSSITLEATGAISSSPTSTFNWSSVPVGFTGTGDSLTATPTQNTTYTVTITDGVNHCTSSISVAVTQTPSAPTVNSPVNYCLNATATALTATGTNLLWYDLATGGVGSITAPTPVTTSAGTTKYWVSQSTTDGCESPRAMIVVNINALPIVSAGNAQSICSGASAQLGASGGTTYVWSPAATLSNPNIANPLATPTVNTTYTVTVTDVNTCVNTSSVDISINPLPIAVATPANQSICTGFAFADIIITTNPAVNANFTWSRDHSADVSGMPTSGSGNISGTLTNTTLFPVNVTFTIIPTSTPESCVGQSITAIVTVNPSPAPTICDDQTICIAASAQLNATGGVAYVWSPATTLNNPDIANPIASPTQNTTYYVTVTDANGCKASTSVDVNLSPALNLTLTSQNVSCFNTCDGKATVAVTGGTLPYQYVWTSSNSNTSIADGLCDGQYTVTVTDAIGCSKTATCTITEPAQLTATIGTPTHVKCWGESNGSAPLNVSGGTIPYTYYWSNGAASQDLSNSYAGTINVTVTDANLCKATTSVTINQPQKLTVTVTPLAESICIGGTVNIISNPQGGTLPYAYHWSNGATTPGQNVSPISLTQYCVNITDANNCKSNNACSTISVNPPLSLSLYTNNDTICPGEPTIINANYSGGNGGPYSIQLEDGTLISPPLSVSPELTTTYKIILSDNCGTPSVEAEITIFVLDPPPIEFHSNIIEGCQPLTVSFNETSPNIGQTYQWNFGDENYSNSSTSKNPTHIFTEAGTYDVSLTVTSQFGCRKTYIFPEMINVYPLPVANFDPIPQIASIVEAFIYFENYTIGAINYYWSFGDGDSSSVKNPIHDYSIAGVNNYIVQLIAVTDKECKDTISKIVEIRDQFTFYAPNAFSPDNDGINDIFYVVGNGINPKTLKMYIYDRWGEVIYETNGYSNEYPAATGWDGKIKGGKKGAIGSYSWIVIYKDMQGIEHQEAGMVTLVR